MPGPHTPPTAAFRANCQGLICFFDATGSSDPDGDPIASYSWTFGGGSTATGATPSHTYSAQGTRTVELTVRDARTAVSTTSQSVFAGDGSRRARDAFTRSLASGWGTAEIGSAWSSPTGNTGLSVTGGTAVADLPDGGSQVVQLASVSTQNTGISATFALDRLPSAGEHRLAVVARRQDATTSYRGRLRILANGTVYAGIERGAVQLAEAQVTGPAGTARDETAGAVPGHGELVGFS